ncbi:MAG TPA: DegT/DnrJ/EryC1/StrS family aminotransferase [Gemmatimonadales bacterium]
MQVPLLDLTAQFRAIRDAVMPAILSVIERQQFIMGPEVGRLETELAALCRTRHAIACASGTDALLLPLRALDLEPGDEVITPAFTFFATAGAVANTGGRPVFVDIEPDTFNLDPRALEAAITPRTRAIIVVHLFGQMAPLERILPLAAERGIPLIEDAAQAIGARRRVDGAWRMAGETGWVGTLSFFPTKNLGGYGDGGMIVTQDDAVAERLRRLRLHGGTRQYHHDEVGTNSRLDSLQAAVLLAKLPFLAGWSEARRRNAARYSEGLAGLPQVRTPLTDPANDHIFHQYTVRVERRNALQTFLRERGVGTAIYYPLALHLQPCFGHLGYRPGSLPASESVMQEVLSLPVYPELEPAQQDWVIESIRAFYD